MARIFVSIWNNVESGYYNGPFFEGLIRSLLRNGNEVLVMENAQLFGGGNYQKNECAYPSLSKDISSYIKNYDPELIISFNHSLLSSIKDELDCPIIQWLSDSYFYMADLDGFVKNQDRYHILCFAECQIFDLVRHLNIKREKINFVPPATDFFPKNMPFAREVSFISSYFGGNELLHQNINDISDDMDKKIALKGMLNSYMQGEELKYKERIKKFKCQSLVKGVEEKYVFNMLSHYKRFTALTNLADLNLELYGGSRWQESSSSSPFLGLCYNPKKVITVEDNENIYNSSKINLNISHVQSRGSLPFRICDIMSSNGLLVSDDLTEAKRIFGKDIFIPTYNHIGEVRAVCQYYLKNDNERVDITKEHQNIIKKSHKFEHRFKSLEDITGVNLLCGKPRKKVDLISGVEAILNSAIPVNSIVTHAINKKGVFKVIKEVLHLLPKPIVALIRKILKRIKRFVPSYIKNYYHRYSQVITELNYLGEVRKRVQSKIKKVSRRGKITIYSMK